MAFTSVRGVHPQDVRVIHATTRAVRDYLAIMKTRGANQPRGDQSDLESVIEAYKRDIDRTLLRQNMSRSPEERVLALMALHRLAAEARRAGRDATKRV